MQSIPNYRVILAYTIVVLFSQAYFHSFPTVINPIDSMQDFAFVLGYSFTDLIKNQYQFYLYGLAPYVSSFFLLHILPAVKSFWIVQTLLSIVYSIIIFYFVSRFLKTSTAISVFLSLVIICLLLNPGSILFGWKSPYTIGNPIGIVFTLLVFIFSIRSLCQQKKLNLFFMMLCAVVALSSKLEYAGITIAYIVFWLGVQFLTNADTRNRKRIAWHVSIILFLLIIAYINWMKLLPNGFKLIDWCTDPTSHLIFIRETMNTGSAKEQLLSNHASQILGIMDFEFYRLINIALQVGAFIMVNALEHVTWLPLQRKKIYCYLIIAIYCLYLVAVALLDCSLVFRDIGIIAIILSVLSYRRFLLDRQMLLLAGFAFLFSFRILLKLEFSFFSIYYMFPVVILFLSQLWTAKRFNAVFALYIGLLFIFLASRTYDYVTDKYRFLTVAQSPQGELYTVPTGDMLPLIANLSQIKKEYGFRTIGSAKNVPLLNVFFNVPNPVKKFVNVEFYPIAYPTLYDSYLADLKTNIPDVFIYEEPIMENYVTLEEHQNMQREYFVKRSNLFISDLKNIYTEEIAINKQPRGSQDSTYYSCIRLFFKKHS